MADKRPDLPAWLDLYPGASQEQGGVRGSSHTRDGVLGVELKRVVHKGSHDGGRGLAVGVGRQQRVVAVVDVGGLVEAKAPVPHGLVRQRRLQELGEDEAGLVEYGAVEEPAQGGRRLPVHREGYTPVMLLHCRAQVHAGWDCGKRARDRKWARGWKDARGGGSQGWGPEKQVVGSQELTSLGNISGRKSQRIPNVAAHRQNSEA